MGSPILSIERSAHATSPESSSPWLDTSSLSLPSSDVPSQMILHMLLRKHLTVLQTPVTLLPKLGTELPPLFLAVFAAIIVAQLFAPLLGALFGAKLNLASGILAPLSSAKIDLINAILNPLNLVLGNVGTCTPAGSGGRSLDSFNMTPDSVLNLILKANEVYNDYSS